MLTPDERAALIDQYAAGYDAVMAALAGATPAEMEAREAPGEWCPREIAHHLGDSEMIAANLVRFLIAVDNPQFLGYDPEALVQALFDDRPIESSLQAFRYARESTLPILRGLDEAGWARAGSHDEEAGPFTVETWLEWYGPHAHDHADQIRRARETVNP